MPPAGKDHLDRNNEQDNAAGDAHRLLAQVEKLQHIAACEQEAHHNAVSKQQLANTDINLREPERVQRVNSNSAVSVTT